MMYTTHITRVAVKKEELMNWQELNVCACVHMLREICKMFVLSLKENVYSAHGLQEYLNNSSDSLKAPVFISSSVTGLINSRGKAASGLRCHKEGQE